MGKLSCDHFAGQLIASQSCSPHCFKVFVSTVLPSEPATGNYLSGSLFLGNRTQDMLGFFKTLI